MQGRLAMGKNKKRLHCFKYFVCVKLIYFNVFYCVQKDTGSALDEIIDYIKFLQQAIKVLTSNRMFFKIDFLKPMIVVFVLKTVLQDMSTRKLGGAGAVVPQLVNVQP